MLDTLKKRTAFANGLSELIMESVIEHLDVEYLCLTDGPDGDGEQVYTPLALDLQQYLKKVILKQLNKEYEIRVVDKIDQRERTLHEILVEVNRDRCEGWEDYTLEDLLRNPSEILYWIDRGHFDVYLNGEQI